MLFSCKFKDVLRVLSISDTRAHFLMDLIADSSYQSDEDFGQFIEYLQTHSVTGNELLFCMMAVAGFRVENGLSFF